MNKLLSIKDQTNRNVGLFNMAHLVCVWENGPIHNDSVTFEFINNRKITVLRSEASVILEKAGFDLIILSDTKE